jgi:hypothetical protein
MCSEIENANELFELVHKLPAYSGLQEKNETWNNLINGAHIERHNAVAD